MSKILYYRIYEKIKNVTFRINQPIIAIIRTLE